MNETSHPSSGEARDSLLLRALHGRLLTADTFARYWLHILLVIFMVLVYINNKYSCQTSMEEIRRLSHRLEVVETERVRVRGEYMSRVRESSMQELVDTMHLGLRVQTQPPFHLSMPKK